HSSAHGFRRFRQSRVRAGGHAGPDRPGGCGLTQVRAGRDGPPRHAEEGPPPAGGGEPGAGSDAGAGAGGMRRGGAADPAGRGPPPGRHRAEGLVMRELWTAIRTLPAEDWKKAALLALATTAAAMIFPAAAIAQALNVNLGTGAGLT